MADINIRNKIAIDAGSNSGVKASVSSYSWNHTVGSLTRGILIVGLAMRGGASANSDLNVSGVTYNSVALTKAVTTNSGDSPSSNTLAADVWYLVNPSSGTNSIAVTFQGTVNHAAGYALSLSQVDQVNPLDQTNSNHALGQASPVSNNVTINNDNGWAFDVIYDKIGTAMTKGASQTLVAAELSPNGGGDRANASYRGPVSPAAATAMSWTYTGSDDYAQALSSFAPAPIQDSVTVTESVSVSIQGAARSVNVSDNVTVTESVSTSITGLSSGNLTSGSSTTDGTVFTTASITPAANALILLSVTSRAAAVQPTISSISGNGLTWVEIDHVDNDNAGSRRTIHLYRALGASPSAGAVTITFADTQTACTWNINQITGVDTSGTNGSGAVVQFADNVNRGPAATSITATLAAFSSADNGTHATFGTGSAGTSPTAGSGFSTISSVQEATESSGALFIEWKNVNDTTADVTFSSDLENGIIAIEVKKLTTDLNVSVSESITITESVGRMLESNRAVSDSVSVSESVGRVLESNINKSESITVTDTPSVSFPLMQTLQDDFEFAELDTGKWDNFGGSQVVVTNRRIELTSDLGGNYVGVTSDMFYNLTGSYGFSQLVDAGNQSIASWEVYPVHLSSGSNAVSIMISGGTVYARKKIAGVSSTVGASVAYNSTTMQWFRIRESLGTTYWEYAQDPTGAWTEIANAANPIAVKALQGEIIVGTWQAEASTTTAKVDNFNLTPGQLQFTWKGYTWNKRIHTGDSMFNRQWDSANVSGPDGSDYITLSLTNPTLTTPTASEIFTDQRGFGYGTYTTVIGTSLDTLHGAIVFGGLFTFDFSAPPAYREIDVNETYKYNGSSTVRLLHSHVYDNGGVRAFITDDVDVPSNQVQTHVMTWTSSQIVFDSYIGTGTGGTLIAHHVHTTNIPTPGSERAHFNLWVANQNSPTTATPTDVVIRDFSFTAIKEVAVSDSITVSESKNIALAHQISVSDSVTVTESVAANEGVNIAVSDSITITENTSTNETSFISVTDNITVAESIARLLISEKSVSDSVSITENVNILLIGDIATNDTVTLTESINNLIIGNISVSDTVTLTENKTLSEISFINVVENISVSESASVVEEVGSDLSITVSDSVSITENVACLLDANISVQETISLSEILSVDVPIAIAKSESITVSENAELQFFYIVSVNDNVTVTENTTLSIPIEISLTETISVSESANVPPITINVATQESITVSENTIEIIPELLISKSDSVSVTESYSVSPVLSIGVTDTVSVSENIAMFTDKLYLSVSENITVQEQVIFQPEYFKNQNMYLDIGQGLSVMIGAPKLAVWGTNGRPQTPRIGEYGFNDELLQIEVWSGTQWLAFVGVPI